MKAKNDSYKLIMKNMKWLGNNAKNTFAYLAGINRPIYPGQVTKLADSINKMGVVRPVIIAEFSFISGKKTKYIIDGQHLFNALIRNNMEIPYVTIDIKDKRELVETIAKLNASSKNWALVDYILAWGALIPDYVKLNHYFQVYDFDMGVISSILMDTTQDGGNIAKRIKDGNFRIINEDKNVELLNNLTDVLKVIPRMDRFQNRYVCREYAKFAKSCSKYDHTKFINNLKKNREKFVISTQETNRLKEMFLELA
jgi:hypothetical protein